MSSRHRPPGEGRELLSLGPRGALLGSNLLLVGTLVPSLPSFGAWPTFMECLACAWHCVCIVNNPSLGGSETPYSVKVTKHVGGSG